MAALQAVTTMRRDYAAVLRGLRVKPAPASRNDHAAASGNVRRRGIRSDWHQELWSFEGPLRGQAEMR